MEDVKAGEKQKKTRSGAVAAGESTSVEDVSKAGAGPKHPSGPGRKAEVAKVKKMAMEKDKKAHLEPAPWLGEGQKIPQWRQEGGKWTNPEKEKAAAPKKQKQGQWGIRDACGS